MRLVVGSLDSAIIEAASNVPKQKPLEYLLGCWKRAVRQTKLMRNNANPDPRKMSVLKEARRLIISYTVFATTDPEMFGVEGDGTAMLANHLLADPECERGVCYDFVTEGMSRLPDDTGVRDMLVDAIAECSRRLSKISMAGEYYAYMDALRHLVIHQPIAEALAQSDYFLPASIEPQSIETSTLLGPFFRLSPLQAEVAKRDFLATTAQPDNIIRNVQDSQRTALKSHQDQLFDITNVLIKSSKTTRERMLDWFAAVVNSNHKRRALQVDWKTVASDGFMVNITTVLDRLCEPFMDVTFSKVHRIEAEYLRRSPRVDITDETKINADQKTSDEFYEQKADGVSNFISEVFFLTVAAHHYGTEAANSQLSNKERNVRHFEKEIEKLEAERGKYLQVCIGFLPLHDGNN
jgi:ubiquitin conjugation factor E4 B